MSFEQAAILSSEALHASARGDHTRAQAMLRELRSGSDSVSRASTTSLRAALWVAGESGGEPPSVEGLAEACDESRLTRESLIPAAMIGVRRHYLAWDFQRMPESAGVFRQLARDLDTPGVQAGLHLVEAWSALASGAAPRALRQADLAAELATRHALAEALVEARSLGALATLEAGDPTLALELARRAMRMARVEELPAAEYLAALTLARARRLNNASHLASRILTSLLSYAPAPWHGSACWELALSSGLACADVPFPPGSAPASFLDWLRAANTSDRDAFARLELELRQRLSGFCPGLADFERARWVVDPEVHECGDSQIESWKHGRVDELGLGLAGLAGIPLAEVTTYACAVSAGPQTPATRVVRVGAGLAQQHWSASSAATAKHARTQTLLAVLVLAGSEGMDERAAFEASYGFRFQPDLHRDTFNVAIHRARSRLSAEDRLVREAGTLRLELAQRTAVPDPRCGLPVAERVLRRVALGSALNARAISKFLGISVRSAQNALETLVEEGACRQRKQGRQVDYLIEDTTFQAPTRHR